VKSRFKSHEGHLSLRKICVYPSLPGHFRWCEGRYFQLWAPIQYTQTTATCFCCFDCNSPLHLPWS
jgi:hypothetical protein